MVVALIARRKKNMAVLLTVDVIVLNVNNGYKCLKRGFVKQDHRSSSEVST